MPQKAVSADIISNFSCWNIFPKNSKNKDISSLGILRNWLPHKFKSLKILGPLSNFSDTAETESEMSSWDQAYRGGKLGLVWRNRKKISQIIKGYLYLPFFLCYVMAQLPCPLSSRHTATSATGPVAGVLDEPYSQLTPLSGVAVHTRQST